ncbi:uncharacterized protein LOC129588358 [Paramacrobiotus metropolitanus]|uniref:uncharacterized protein LOC129588358 n=1 Tax=Paramacrobiotus metropolitanus TaxID=2943436 RepID=UPI0024463BD8|nr:uncharacterized protein LOC129588358 [Paramacrobiotus metropolitanus]
MVHKTLAFFVALYGISWVTCRGDDNFPRYDGTQVSQRECASRPRNTCWKGLDNCLEASIGQMIFRRVPGTISTLECYNNVTARDFLDSASSIAISNPNRAVRLFAPGGDSFQLTHQLVDPIRTQLIELYFWHCRDNSATSTVGALRLPNLLYLQFSGCTRLVIKRDDFRHFKNLRNLDFYLTTIESIEPETFKDLPQLRSLQLENRYASFLLRLGEADFTSEYATPEIRSTIRKLHCACDYAWLRNWLDANPYLLSDRDEGELYVIGNHASASVSRRAMFLAVDCASKNLSIFQRYLEYETDFHHKFAINTSC